MGKILGFEYYEKDKLCTKVSVNYSNNTVNVVNFTDDIISQAFGKRAVTVEDIDDFFRNRVFPESRVDVDVLLDLLGLDHFDAEAIARKTHGMLWEDFFWVKFDNENLSYEDIKKIKGWKD